MLENGELTRLKSFRVSVVTSAGELIQVIAVRSICLMEESGLTYSQVNDGNDYQATHVLMHDGDEPIATTRIRWFADFAKVEKTVLRKAYRQTKALRLLGDFVFGHVANKGYSTVIAHAEPVIARLWRTMFQFVDNTEKPPMKIAGKDYEVFELIKHMEVPPTAITRRSSPAEIMRIEGYWDVPAVYE